MRAKLSLTLREEDRLRMFGKRALRKMFGPKMDGVTGGLRKLRTEKLHDCYCSQKVIRVTSSRGTR